MSNWRATPYGDSLYTATMSIGDLEAEFPHEAASAEQRRGAKRSGNRARRSVNYGKRKLATSGRISPPGTAGISR
jgi:hypothetical protein